MEYLIGKAIKRDNRLNLEERYVYELERQLHEMRMQRHLDRRALMQ